MIEWMIASSWKPVAFVAFCVLALLGAGCNGSGSNKAGGSSEKTVVLTLADPEYGGLDDGRWVREAERTSGGTIRIDVRDRWRAKERDYDRGTIEDVRAGRVDIAKIAARSWDAAGVSSFRALVAPLLIDSYPLERHVLASNLPARMLPAVEKLDLVGLAVLPGMLRKPLGVKRILRTPQDFAGATIGIRPSRVAGMTFRALGSGTVAYVPGDSAEVSRLDGAELSVDVINGAGYYRRARALTANVNLWPRVVTLVMNKRVFDALSERQKEALRSAAAAVIDPQVRDMAALDRQMTRNLCHRGLTFVSAKPADLAALAKAVRPVYAELERDHETRQLIDEISTLKQRLGTGARRPVACKGGEGNVRVRTGASPIDGVYHSTVTRAELLRNPAYEQGEDGPSNYGSFTLRIANGRFEWTSSADGIPEGGTLTVAGDRVTIRPTHPPDVAGEEDVYRWSVYRGVLRFRKVTGGPTLLVVHPWRPG